MATVKATGVNEVLSNQYETLQLTLSFDLKTNNYKIQDLLFVLQAQQAS